MIVLTGFILIAMAYGKAPQSMVSSPSTVPTVRKSTESADEPSDKTLDPASLRPDLPKLLPQKASLIGGAIEKIDRIQDRLTVQVFGGGRVKIAFDPRTHIYRNGAPAGTSDLRIGDHVYIDTMLDGSTVFARNIRLKNTLSTSASQGVVERYRADKGELVVRDELSPEPLRLRVTPATRFLQGGQAASANALTPGTLVAVQAAPQSDGRSIAREIYILAVPGTSFTFAGRVTALDLSTGLLVVNSSTDGKTYEIHIDPSAVAVDDSLRQTADVTVLARFDGSRYEAQSVTVNSKNGR